MYCKNCGEQMNDYQSVCLKCGVKKGSGSNFCSNCGNPLQSGASVCLNCGAAVSSLGVNDKWVMAIICFFLGALGIHNFIMGENKKGITKIVLSFCCGISWIFALVDFVKILSDKYVVDPDKLI